MAKNTRIDKLFSDLGIMSRSDCKRAVKQGKIALNGHLCADVSQKCDPENDTVTLDGEKVDTRLIVYYMLNKPAGVITASEDPRCETVMDFIEDGRDALSPVGRLDKDTTGFLLITNDGQLNHRLLSPRYHVPKTYRTLIDGILTDEDIRRLTRGIDIGDDRPTLPAELSIADVPDDGVPSHQTVFLTITEGRYHQVKRMFEAVGKPVLSLHRSSFGPLELDPSLQEGEYRELTAEELNALISCTE